MAARYCASSSGVMLARSMTPAPPCTTIDQWCDAAGCWPQAATNASTASAMSALSAERLSRIGCSRVCEEKSDVSHGYDGRQDRQVKPPCRARTDREHGRKCQDWRHFLHGLARLQHAALDLVEFDRFKQRFEIALAEAFIALALDEF